MAKTNYHVAIGLKHLYLCLQGDEYKGKPQQIFYDKEGNSVTYEEAYNQIAELQNKGFDCWPPCDNYDSKGYCKGHLIT